TAPPPAPTPVPTPVPTPTPTPVPGAGATLFVDPNAGDDGNGYTQAQSQASAWRTINRAVHAAKPGDVITLLPGRYAEAVELVGASQTLRGAGTLGQVVIAPPAASPSPPGIYIGGLGAAHLENLVVEGGAQGILAVGATDLVIRNCAVVNPQTNGIQTRS